MKKISINELKYTDLQDKQAQFTVTPALVTTSIFNNLYYVTLFLHIPT
jgi:hypothetical protein